MAGEPKRRHSKARKRTRRSAIKLAVSFIICKNCGKPTKPHIACIGCGFYKGINTSKSNVEVTKV